MCRCGVKSSGSAKAAYPETPVTRSRGFALSGGGRVVNARGDARYTRLVADLKDGWREAGRVCARCGQRIDYELPRWHPQSCHAGHIKSWHDFPELRVDPQNFQPEHKLCNETAGKDGAPVGLGTTSEDW